MNREAWLTTVARRVGPFFKGYRLGPYRVTCGWPSSGALAARRQVVGQCHYGEHSAGGACELFVSPVLHEPLEVAGTLLHEMAHVVAGPTAGHGPRFVQVCKAVGLTKGRPTNVMPGRKLGEALARIVESLPPYPHHALRPPPRVVTVQRTAVTLACPSCGCRVRMAIKWLASVGPPTCGCGHAMSVPLPEGE